MPKIVAVSGTINNGKTTCLDKWSKCNTVRIYPEIARAVIEQGDKKTMKDIQTEISRQEYARSKELKERLSKKRQKKLFLTDRTTVENSFFMEYGKIIGKIPSYVKPYAISGGLDIYDKIILFVDSIHDDPKSIRASDEFREFYLQRMRETFPSSILHEFKTYKDDQEAVDAIISEYV